MSSKVGPWPTGCCVAAFVAAALNELLHVHVDRGRVARALETTVGPEDHNPLGLAVDPDPFRRGVPGTARTRWRAGS